MIIGLGHTARVGKDTAGSILVEEHGFTRLSFADKLKALALKIDPKISTQARLGMVVAEFGFEEAKSLFPEVRVFLQHLGVACRDQFHANVWVNPVIDAVLENPKRDYVVTDVRFRNEAAGLRELSTLAGLGVHLVKVERPGFGPSGHVSETELSNFAWDQVLANDGTIADLAGNVEVLLGALAPPAPQ